MVSLCKIIAFLIFVISNLNTNFARPVPNGIKAAPNVQRAERQVVQPTWLTNFGGTNKDSKVHITQQSLDEAAAIRDTIQQAVADDTFFVNTDQLNEPNANGDSAKESATEPPPTLPPPNTTPARPHAFFFDFQFPMWGGAVGDAAPVQIDQVQAQQQQQQQQFMADMQRQWLEFWEQSWRMFNWN